MRDRYLLVKGAAGLGNRIESLLTAVLYARLAGRKLAVDWSDETFSPDGCNVFPVFFSLKNISLSPRFPQSSSVRPREWVGRLGWTVPQMFGLFPARHLNRKALGVLDSLDHPESVLVVWFFGERIERLRKFFNGEFSGWLKLSRDEILRRLAREHLVMDETIVGEAESFRKSGFSNPMTGVHVRYTDRKMPLPLVERVTAEALRKNKSSGIFFSSDSPEAEKRFREKFPEVLIAGKSRTDPAIDARPRKTFAEERLLKTREALRDMLLLTACDQLVISRRSSFARMALALSACRSGDVWDIDAFPYKVSVIVVHSGDVRKLQQTLCALSAQTYPRDFYEVVVVDLTGREDLQDSQKASGFCVRRIMACGCGLYEARNRGIEEAAGEMIGFIDSGLVPDRSWISKAAERLHRSGFAAYLGGAVRRKRGGRDCQGPVEFYRRSFLRWAVRHHYLGRHAEFQARYGFPEAANFFTFRHVLDDSGVFKASVSMAGDWIWKKSLESRGRLYAFLYDSAIDVEAETGHDGANAFWKEIFAFGREAFETGALRPHGWRLFPSDLCHLFGTIFSILRGGHALSLTDRLRFLAVLVPAGLVRMGGRAFRVSGPKG